LSFDESCIFCKIARKQATASIVYEDEIVLAFLDIRPLNEGHTLIIPKQHYIDIFDTPDELISKVYTIAKQVSSAVKKTTNSDGITFIQQNGKAAGQDIFHIHVHVVPRFEGQKLPGFSSLKEIERAKLEEMSKKIKHQLKKPT
jgi:histidine triad (HIT) family protein